ncbi:threonine/homoserine/homoserine lactone efflux protein [Acinetobacter calcoaceticus]|uniref:Threonine/homoserine/homoserine lactone efflux protein n=1 Tax=Acinetobacter calcoaceticus TaxID=471 RepID=A0A4R1XAI4_ACICA|nr:threonine/homoserine/homoserine lactone efflux protein [Acinetobacter calcoaceticus]
MLLIFSMFSFALSMSISPGPVNFTILSSAMNYGFKNTIAFLSGATIGFTALLAAVCFGLFQLLHGYPIFLDALSIFGAALLMWMGWGIFRADPTQVQAQQQSQAPGFFYGVMMQWLNPKAWIAAFTGTAIFSVRQSTTDLMLFVLIYFVVCYVSLLIWAILGEKMALFLNQGQRMRIMNRIMGIILIAIALDIGMSRFLV